MHDYPLGLLALSALFPATLGALFIRHAFEISKGRRRGLAIGLMAFTLVFLGTVVWSVLVPRQVLGEGTLALEQHMSVTLGPEPAAVLVKGQLPPIAMGGQAEGSFSMEAKAEGVEPEPLTATFSKRYEQGQRSRGAQVLVEDLEHRFNLEPQFSGKTVDLTLTRTDETVRGPLEIEVIVAPPSPRDVAWMSLAPVLLALALDAVNQKKTWYTPVMAALGVYASLVAYNVVPHGTFRPLLGAAMAAVAVGLLGGVIFRALGLALVGVPLDRLVNGAALQAEEPAPAAP